MQFCVLQSTRYGAVKMPLILDLHFSLSRKYPESEVKFWSGSLQGRMHLRDLGVDKEKGREDVDYVRLAYDKAQLRDTVTTGIGFCKREGN
jgi:hypothetical protein